MRMQSGGFRFGLRSAICFLATAVTAVADQNSPSSADTTTNVSDTLEQIVVTAERRRTYIMTTPLAMTALSGDALLARNVTDLEGLTSFATSFTFANQGPTAAINIRGIGLAVSSPNVASGV